MADPTVINWIAAAAKRYGADPAAMLATSLVENGARMGLTPGDNNSSYGYFQMHRGGALGSNTPQWATTAAVADNRAREFARLKVHGGVGAAAVQRPGDPTGYAAKVQARLAEARQLLHQSAGLPVPAAPGQPAAAAPAGGMLAGGRSLQATVSAILNAADPAAAVGQFNAGRMQVQLPMTAASTAPGAPPELSFSGKPGVVTTFSAHPKIIGTPYHGTHTLGNWESDNAIDIALPKGTPLYAAFTGTIGSQFGSLGSSSSRFAGLRLHLQGKGNELYYAHLSKFAPGIKPGVTVQKGQIIGYSGEANGVQHLHLGSKNVNPMIYA